MGVLSSMGKGDAPFAWLVYMGTIIGMGSTMGMGKEAQPWCGVQ